MVRIVAVCALAALVAVTLVGEASGKAAKTCKEDDVKVECASWAGGNVDTKKKCEDGAYTHLAARRSLLSPLPSLAKCPKAYA